MILSHQHKFIFFCNPKTGSTSVENSLIPYQEGQEFNCGLRQFEDRFLTKVLFQNKHLPPAMLRAWLPQETWENYYKFVFVRNPWDWFVSEWKYHFRLNRLDRKDFIKRPRSVAAYYKNYFWLKNLYQKKKFDEKDVDFLYGRLKRGFSIFPNSKGLYQSHYVCDIDGNIIVDFVARFENIQNDFLEIKSQVGLDIKLTHLNKTKHDSYQTYFTKESRQRVAELWKEDIERFGYSFD